MCVIDSRFTDGGEVVSPTLQPPIIPRKISGFDFRTIVAAGRIRVIEKSSDLIGDRARDLFTL
jgi:hypothetical protein